MIIFRSQSRPLQPGQYNHEGSDLYIESLFILFSNVYRRCELHCRKATLQDLLHQRELFSLTKFINTLNNRLKGLRASMFNFPRAFEVSLQLRRPRQVSIFEI